MKLRLNEFNNFSILDIQVLNTEHTNLKTSIILNIDDNLIKTTILIPFDRYNDIEIYLREINDIEFIKLKPIKKTIILYEEDSFEKIEEDNLKLIIDLENEVDNLNLNALGSIIYTYGKKYSGKTVQEIYEIDKGYIEWISKNKPFYPIINESVIKKEKSRQSLIKFYKNMETLNKIKNNN